jgi:hypothetical protein
MEPPNRLPVNAYRMMNHLSGKQEVGLLYERECPLGRELRYSQIFNPCFYF